MKIKGTTAITICRRVPCVYDTKTGEVKILKSKLRKEHLVDKKDIIWSFDGTNPDELYQMFNDEQGNEIE